MSGLLWFVVGLFVGVYLGFALFCAFQVSRKADRNEILIDDDVDIAESFAANELRKIAAKSARV
jgi:hypothetical protein